MRQKKSVRNVALLVLGVAMALAGVVLQVHYHLLHGTATSTVAWLDRPAWNVVHLWSAIGFSLVLSLHLWAHRKWVRGVIRRRRWAKNWAVLFLIFLAFLTFGLGFVSLCVSGVAVVEIHDKVAIFFLIFTFAHVVRRFQ